MKTERKKEREKASGTSSRSIPTREGRKRRRVSKKSASSGASHRSIHENSMERERKSEDEE